MKVHQNMKVGSMIHAMSNEQDMRKMGRFASLLPFTYVMMFIINLSLIGFLCIGFYSKDVI
jgi:NADH-quinone oxidoreductase subunit L